MNKGQENFEGGTVQEGFPAESGEWEGGEAGTRFVSGSGPSPTASVGQSREA